MAGVTMAQSPFQWHGPSEIARDRRVYRHTADGRSISHTSSASITRRIEKTGVSPGTIYGLDAPREIKPLFVERRRGKR